MAQARDEDEREASRSFRASSSARSLRWLDHSTRIKRAKLGKRGTLARAPRFPLRLLGPWNHGAEALHENAKLRFIRPDGGAPRFRELRSGTVQVPRRTTTDTGALAAAASWAVDSAAVLSAVDRQRRARSRPSATATPTLTPSRKTAASRVRSMAHCTAFLQPWVPTQILEDYP